MVSYANQTTRHSPVNQGDDADVSKPNKIGASTPFDFNARNLTAYGGAASGDHDAGVARIPSVGRGKPDGEALSTRGMGKSLPVAAGKSPSHEVAEGFLQSGITANNREFGLRCPNGPFCRESLPYPHIHPSLFGYGKAWIWT
jgi:hypothetical protein